MPRAQWPKPALYMETTLPGALLPCRVGGSDVPLIGSTERETLPSPPLPTMPVPPT